MGVEISGRKGAATHVREACHALQRKGHEVRLITPAPGDKSQVRVPIVEVCPPAAKWIGADLRYMFLNRRMKAAIERTIKESRPDAVYERYSLYQTAGQSVCRKYGIPRILEVNTLLASEQAKRLHWPSVARNVEARLWRGERSIVAVSQRLKNLMIEAAALDETKMIGFVISPVAVDPETFHSGIPPVKDPAFGVPGKKIAGYMGTLTSWHGVDLFFDAAQMLRDGGHPVAIVAVGGEAERVERLRARAKECNVEQNLLFFGSIPFASVPSYLAAMDVCLIPDTQDWSSPTKFFEFAAMEKPVVAARSPAVEEVFGPDLHTGLLFERGNAQDMARRIVEVISDPDKAREVGAAARRRVLEKYTWDRSIGVMMDLYQRMGAASSSVVPAGAKAD